MLDLSQFDGHTPGPWKKPWWLGGSVDAALAIAAPDILAEVKRLRAALSDLICRINRDGGHAMTGDLLADAEAADAVAAERNARCDELEAELARYKEALTPSESIAAKNHRALNQLGTFMAAIRRRAEGK